MGIDTINGDSTPNNCMDGSPKEDVAPISSYVSISPEGKSCDVVFVLARSQIKFRQSNIAYILRE